MRKMKKYNKIIGLFLVGILTLSSCNEGLEEKNINPNDPEIAPTYTIFNRAVRRVMDNSRDEWVGGRLLYPWVQYTSQINYVEEDKYDYRLSNAQTSWNELYLAAQNFKQIIDFAEDPNTSVAMSAYGNLNNQIAASRVMLAYTFLNLVEEFGDVPYYSYSTADPDFEALQLSEDILNPVYASQEKIYQDLLKELSEANDQFVLNEKVFVAGDGIYDGDASKWKKFANSLRLRIANRVKDVLPSAVDQMKDAVNDGVFSNNSDNAMLAYGSSSLQANPFWASFFVENRTDFAVNNQFVKLLKGENGDFGYDPRLQQMVAPKGVGVADAAVGNYTPSAKLSDYQGMPYGLPEDLLSANNKLENISFFSDYVLSPDHGEMLMEYAEVEFILSEMNGWSQANYEKGVRASMERWNVSPSDIDAFVGKLPAANAKEVITQKYVALFMQPLEAWSEYRRTGYPDTDVLLLPGETTKDVNGTDYTFVPLRDINHVPYRLAYPDGEQSLNNVNRLKAASNYDNGDDISSKLWWMK